MQYPVPWACSSTPCGIRIGPPQLAMRTRAWLVLGHSVLGVKEVQGLGLKHSWEAHRLSRRWDAMDTP